MTDLKIKRLFKRLLLLLFILLVISVFFGVEQRTASAYSAEEEAALEELEQYVKDLL